MRKKSLITVLAFACQLKALEGNKDQKIIDQNCKYVHVEAFKPCDLEHGFIEASVKDLGGYEDYEAERAGCVRKALKAVGEAVREAKIHALDAKKHVSEGWSFTARKVDKGVSVFFDYLSRGFMKCTNLGLDLIDLI